MSEVVAGIIVNSLIHNKSTKCNRNHTKSNEINDRIKNINLLAVRKSRNKASQVVCEGYNLVR